MTSLSFVYPLSRQRYDDVSSIRDGPDVGQIGPKWDKSVTSQDQISVNSDSQRDLKKSLTPLPFTHKAKLTQCLECVASAGKSRPLGLPYYDSIKWCQFGKMLKLITASVAFSRSSQMKKTQGHNQSLAARGSNFLWVRIITFGVLIILLLVK